MSCQRNNYSANLRCGSRARANHDSSVSSLDARKSICANSLAPTSDSLRFSASFSAWRTSSNQLQSVSQKAEDEARRAYAGNTLCIVGYLLPSIALLNEKKGKRATRKSCRICHSCSVSGCCAGSLDFFSYSALVMNSTCCWARTKESIIS